MKREEKNQHSRQKIMDAALKEFGEKSYEQASLNTICREGDISKGIIYHYFEDKDELYLACLHACFDTLTAYLKEHAEAGEAEIEAVLNRYFDARIIFFHENPHYLRLFYSAVIAPPAHLKTAISGIREDFDALNIRILTRLLSRAQLREGVTTGEVIKVFSIFQDLVNTHYQLEARQPEDIREHEEMCGRILKILLYGVIERG